MLIFNIETKSFDCEKVFFCWSLSILNPYLLLVKYVITLILLDIRNIYIEFYRLSSKFMKYLINDYHFPFTVL